MSISPNEVLPVPACNFALPISVRYASSTGRGYVESESGGGCFTLTQVEELSDKPFLFPIDPATNRGLSGFVAVYLSAAFRAI